MASDKIDRDALQRAKNKRVGEMTPAELSDRMFWRTMRAFSSLTDDERRALLRAVSKMEG